MACGQRGSMGAKFRACWINPQFCAFEFADAGFFFVFVVLFLFGRFAIGCACAESGAAAV